MNNFGTISAAGGFAPNAIELGPASTLVFEAGCAFNGEVLGDTGKLFLADGGGSLEQQAGDAQTVSGSMDLTTFSSFGVVEVAAGAAFGTVGKVTIGAGQSVIYSGGLVLSGKKVRVAKGGTMEVLAGTLSVEGAVTG